MNGDKVKEAEKKLKLKLHEEEKLEKTNSKSLGSWMKEDHPPECKKLQVQRINHIGKCASCC